MGGQNPLTHKVVLSTLLLRLINFYQPKEDTMPTKLDVHVKAVASELELILELLGGTEEQRWRAIEALKGITSRAVTSVVATQLQAAAQSLKSVNLALKTLKANVKELEEA